MPGVRTADINYDAKEAYVVYDPAKCSIPDMDAALRKVGFRGKFKRNGGKKAKKSKKA